MSAPRISVVIPAYNAAAFIEKTLETVAAQSFKDFEVVVVDDGSKDDTAVVVERFLKFRGLRGRCVRQANKRIAGARNAGVRESAAALISFLDHDDLWLPEKLEKSLQEFDLHPDADLVCHNETIVKDGKVVGTTNHGPAVPRMHERLLFKGNTLSPSCVTVRKAKLDEIGGFCEDPAYNSVEDYDVWIRLAQVCRFHFFPAVLGTWIMDAGGASSKVIYHHTNLENMLRDHFSRLPGNGWRLRLMMRRRLAWVWRAAARALMAQGDCESARRYAWKALTHYPFDWKNPVTAVEWLARSLAKR
ncbi:MAG: glycosyltransferase family 2 protein [Elusimicrobia bacterium]|nr:glycosyltransferase family 2 protein [Elusimicrobiota bacterium]